MNAQLTEIMRLITNLIRIGTVTEVDRDTSTMAPLVGWKSTEQAVTTTYSSVSAISHSLPGGIRSQYFKLTVCLRFRTLEEINRVRDDRK